MNIDRVSATAFMTKDSHIAFEQPRSERIVVPQAIIVGSVTHWKPAYTKELNIALGIFPKPVLVKSEARTVNRLLSLLKMPIAYMLIAVTRIAMPIQVDAARTMPAPKIVSMSTITPTIPTPM